MTAERGDVKAREAASGPNFGLVCISLALAAVAFVHAVTSPGVAPTVEREPAGAADHGAPPPDVQPSASSAPDPVLSRAGVREALREVRGLRHSPDTPERNRERVRAIRALADRGQVGQEALWELALRGPDPFERLTAVNVLWAGEGRERLLALAGSTQDDLLRKKIAALTAAEER